MNFHQSLMVIMLVNIYSCNVKYLNSMILFTLKWIVKRAKWIVIFCSQNLKWMIWLIASETFSIFSFLLFLHYFSIFNSITCQPISSFIFCSWTDFLLQAFTTIIIKMSTQFDTLDALSNITFMNLKQFTFTSWTEQLLVHWEGFKKELKTKDEN